MMSEECVSSASSASCMVCGFQGASRQKLKSHLLLKHSELNVCLFCVDVKGWSDTFASQTQYNEHYAQKHQGEQRRRQQQEAELVRRERRARWKEERALALARGERPPKRPSVRAPCPIQPCTQTFPHAPDLDRHLIASHGYDYCKICQLIGVPAAVRYHIMDAHVAQLCHVCCSSSPVFKSPGSLYSHLSANHRAEKNRKYQCSDCPVEEQPSFSDPPSFREHLLQEHLTKGDVLKPMRRKYQRHLSPSPPPIQQADQAAVVEVEDPDVHKTPALVTNSPEEAQFELKKVTGIKNSNGQDCFAIAALHLLAQTELGSRIPLIPKHEECSTARCVIGQFLHRYACEAKYGITYRKQPTSRLTSETVSKHFRSLGLENLPVDTGDFLRAALGSLHDDDPEHPALESDPRCLFSVHLEWKFECSECLRFMVMNMRDNVMRVDGSSKTSCSLKTLIDDHLHTKTCRCGSVNQVIPNVRLSGDYLLVEVDRACATGNDAKELILYSLQLEQSYSIFGFRYRLLGTISYNLDAIDGGHYITYLFPNSQNCIHIHESEIKTMRRKPDFDADTVIVALKRAGNEADDLRHIDIELNLEESESTTLSQECCHSYYRGVMVQKALDSHCLPLHQAKKMNLY